MNYLQKALIDNELIDRRSVDRYNKQKENLKNNKKNIDKTINKIRSNGISSTTIDEFKKLANHTFDESMKKFKKSFGDKNGINKNKKN